MQTLDWHLLLLQDNPFSVSPPEAPKDVKWAGMHELKGQIEQKLLETTQVAATQVVLCRGLLGTGKTHAMLYYTLLNRWPIGSEVQNVFVIPVRLSKETDRADKDFY